MRHDWLGIEKTIHQCETVGFLVWYSYKGTKRIGFIYERLGGQLLVNVPRNSYGEEIWVAQADAVPLTHEENEENATAIAHSCADVWNEF